MRYNFLPCLMTVVILYHVVSLWAIPPAPWLVEKWKSGNFTMGAKRFNDPDRIRQGRILNPGGTEKVVVIMVGFTDVPGQRPQSEIQDGFLKPTWPSVKSYFAEVSYGGLTVTGSVNGWYQTGMQMRDYGRNVGLYDVGVEELVKKACELADDDVDFSEYDTNGDGIVDHVFVVHAGNDEASTGIPNEIWSVFLSDLSMYNINHDGVQVITAGVGAEEPMETYPPIGIWAHEYCHSLGAPDLYSYTASTEPVGAWCLMSWGAYLGNKVTPCHLCGYLKWDIDANPANGHQGWINPTMLTQSAEDIPLENTTGTNLSIQFYKVDTLALNVYYLFENRESSSYDYQVLDEGMVIWRIDENVQPDSWGLINEDPFRIWVEDAADPFHTQGGIYYRGIDAAFSEDDGQTVFDKSSDMGVEVTGISASRTTMTFDLQLDDRINERAGISMVRNVIIPGMGIDYIVGNVYIPQTSDIEIKIYTLLGDQIVKLVDHEVWPPGQYEIMWDGRDENRKIVYSGIYVLLLHAKTQDNGGVFSESEKVVVVR